MELSNPTENQATKDLQVPNKTPRINAKRKGMDKPVLQSLQLNPVTPKNSSVKARPETSPAIIKEALYNPRSRSRLQYLNKEQSYNMLKTNKQNSLEEKQSINRPLTQQSTSTFNRQKGNELSTLQRNKSNFIVENDRKKIQQNIENRLELNAKVSREKSQYSSQTKVDKIEEEVKLQRGQIRGNRKRFVNKLEVLPKEGRVLQEGNTRLVTPQHKEPYDLKGRNLEYPSENKVISAQKEKVASLEILNQNSQTKTQSKKSISDENLSRNTRTRTETKKGSRLGKLSQNTQNLTQSKKVDDKSSTPNVNILKLDNEVETLMSTKFTNDPLVGRRHVAQEEKPFKATKVQSYSLHDERGALQEEKRMYINEKKEKHENRMRNGLDTPQSNNRYSKGIKARLAQLFTSKNTPGNTEILPDHEDVLHGLSSVR